ncbi:MAG: hypothetical protein LRS49_05255, partial [Desulfurococcales archaeon]|nr:hypothetical protein [Desulfurococcales archaeon]
VNGTLIADWDDTNPNGFTLYLTVADVSSNITTGLTGDDSGYTRLDVDGRNIIYSQASSDQVDVDGVEPDSSGYLYLSYHPSNSQLVVDATASSIVVNGQPVPILAVGGALAASAVLLAYALSGRRPRGASRGEG